MAHNLFVCPCDTIAREQGNRAVAGIVDKTTSEKLRMIEQLEEPDKQALFRMIDCMLTKKKFKEFFQKNVAAL